MCERTMSSIDLFKAAKKAYSSRKGFDEHSVPGAYPDQLKDMWFCACILQVRHVEDPPGLYTLGYSGEPSGKVLKKFSEC